MDTTKKPSLALHLALSFVFPFVILGALFALNRVFPFGNKQILIHDLIDQYYPFLSEFWYKLRTGTVSPWSWTAGMGHDYVALIAYYMATPLNLLTLLFPHEALREVLTFTLLIKIGCAGLFTGIYLRYARKECGPKLPVFSSLYALCAFTLGYYHNIIWFDSFALLPLVALGLLALMNEGKFRLYIVSLALAVLANFYMGFIICVFVAITFLCQCIMQKLNVRHFLRKLASVAACSCLAIGMTAVLTIPAYMALQNTHRVETMLITKLFVFKNFFDVMGNFIAFTPSTVFSGIPNLYCGMISVMLTGLFFQSKEIAIRKKLILAGILVFLFISLNFNAPYMMMHGFRYPVGFPARFSFLISFVLVVLAFRAFSLIENMNKRGFKRGFWAMAICALFFLLSGIFGCQENKYVISSAILCAVYIFLLYLLINVKKSKGRNFVTVLFSF